MIRTPYLIQRGVINTPLADVNTRLSQAVTLEYMGSAEFEFGALPKSLRAIEALMLLEDEDQQWNGHTETGIRDGERALRIYGAFSDDEYDEYVAFLKRLRDPNERVHLKEVSNFEEGHRERWKHSHTDFWWDLDNHVMFGFDKMFMNRLPSYIAASIRYMNEQQAK